MDGVLGFLAEALASLGRRPQFYWGVMQSLLPSQTPAAESGRLQDDSFFVFQLPGQRLLCISPWWFSSDSGVTARTMDRLLCAAAGRPPSDPPFSLLPISAVQQALKVACSSKLPSESRTWVSAYTAAVTAQLLRIQIDPQPLCCLVIGLFQQAADSKSAGVISTALAAAGEVELDAAKAADLPLKHAEHAVVLSLPVEAQPLASLQGFAQDLLSRWQNHGRTSETNPSKPVQADQSASNTPEASTQGSKKKRKGEGVQASGKVQSRKKQKSGPEAEESALHSIAETLQARDRYQQPFCCLP